MKNHLQLNSQELTVFKRLTTPRKIQDFLDTIPINFEKNGETLMSPRRVLEENKAHCVEGAFFAAAILWFHGREPLLLDLRTIKKDFDHVVALFREGKYWGAISKTNHHILRYRDPVYTSVRELAMSYFHEYFWDDGSKTMRSFSRPFNLKKFNSDWVTSKDNLWDLATALDESPHSKVLDRKMIAQLKKATSFEVEATENEEWPDTA